MLIIYAGLYCCEVTRRSKDVGGGVVSNTIYLPCIQPRPWTANRGSGDNKILAIDSMDFELRLKT